ncbi:hypothetical protein Tco_1077836 [Tanacetum coccineum]
MNSEADGESEPAEQRPVSSSNDTLAPSSKFPLALVVAPPRIRQRPTTLIRPGEVSLGQTLSIPQWARKMLTARKRNSSSSSSPSDHLYTGHHTAPPMLIHLHHRDLFIDHLLGFHDVVRLLDVGGHLARDVGPLLLLVTITYYVSRSIAPYPADLFTTIAMSFRDSYSPEDIGEEHMEVDTADAEAIVDVGISEGVVAHPEDGVGMGFEITASDVIEDDEEFEAEASAADTREIAVDPLAIGDSFESSRGGGEKSKAKKLMIRKSKQLRKRKEL